jgi:hypothetical protein
MVHAASSGRQSASLNTFSTRARASGAVASARSRTHVAATSAGLGAASAFCTLASTGGRAVSTDSRSTSEPPEKRARMPAAGTARRSAACA